MTSKENEAMRIGIDLGGTKIEVVALDCGGQVLACTRVPTPVGDYEGTVRAVAGLVVGVEAQAGQHGTVGIGTPGAISAKTGLMKNSNSVVLNGKPLGRDLAAALGRPVRLENDANCFALSEAMDGAGAGQPSVFGVILGTGVGGGLVIHGEILPGANGIAGEWGHNPLPWASAIEQPGPACYCGRRGCIETFLSGAGLARDAAASPEEIARAAEAGDSHARVVLARYQDRLARALASVINIADPHAIVLGGGLSNIEALYRGLAARVASYCFSDGVDTSILHNKHGDSSGVRGAAWLGASD
jgi:fructokinase